MQALSEAAETLLQYLELAAADPSVADNPLALAVIRAYARWVLLAAEHADIQPSQTFEVAGLYQATNVARCIVYSMHILCPTLEFLCSNC